MEIKTSIDWRIIYVDIESVKLLISSKSNINSLLKSFSPYDIKGTSVSLIAIVERIKRTSLLTIAETKTTLKFLIEKLLLKYNASLILKNMVGINIDEYANKYIQYLIVKDELVKRCTLDTMYKKDNFNTDEFDLFIFEYIKKYMYNNYSIWDIIKSWFGAI